MHVSAGVMKKFLLIFPLMCLAISAWGQKVGVKTNLLYDMTGTVNLGVEVGLAPKWSLDISGNYNAWDYAENTKMRHFLVQPEARYWLCEKFNGHFFGLHLHGGQFNAGGIKLPFGIMENLYQYRNQGWYYGAGIGYGYSWIIGDRWNIEAEIGVGYIGSDFDRFECVECGTLQGNFHKDYFGLTKLSVSIVFLIK